jgi:hypothetical protein
MTGVVFESLSSPPRIRVADAVGHEQTDLYTDQPCTLTPTTVDFPFRVTDAVETTISGFEIPKAIQLYVRDSSGRMVVGAEHDCEHSLPADDYFIELSTSVKIYIEVSSSISIDADLEQSRVSFDGPTRLIIASRSPRSRPPETVTTTDDPEDLMTALSCLGEGILADSPDRSYPTIRGHPPEIALGSELEVPSNIEPHDSDVVLELPPRVDVLYPAVPLVYYLDASIQPGETPRIVADGETVYETSLSEFPSAIKDILPHVFLLDCLSRRAGFYPFEIGAHERVADDLSFDPADYYDRPLAEQLQVYLEVPFETLKPYLPQWSVTAHVEPDTEHVTAMPYLAAQLAFVECTTYPRVTGDDARKASMQAFVEGGSSPTRATTDVFNENAAFVDVSPDSRTLSDIWVGDDIPLRASKFMAEGYQNRHDREPLEERTVTVTIVCNESWMDGEAAAVEELYGTREDLPFNIRTHDGLTCDELTDVIQRDTDFFHYIGHAEPKGLQCTDGFLDIQGLSSVGTDIFFLNACQSYRQAAALVEAGAIGGIATLSDVIDEPASAVGRTTARMLNQGFGLRDALSIARNRSFTGGQYLTIGDDSATFLRAEGYLPNRCIVAESANEFHLSMLPYTNQYGLGGMITPYTDSEGKRYLSGTLIGPYNLSKDELVDFLQLQDVPTEFEGEFYWASDLAEELE